MHDPRVGRFFAVDPLAKEYPFYSPYAFSGNRVINAVELEGLEPSNVNIDKLDLDYTGQGNDKSSYKDTKDGKIYNWSIGVNNKGERNWVKGTQYTGPTKDEAANLANAVYNVSKRTAKKGVEAPNTEYKLIEGINALGFSAGLYQREIDGVKFNAMAFAGTDGGYDAITDISQSFNMPDYQYAFAARFGDLAKGKKNFTFVGHSLGGGLAALASSLSNQPAITFNAAGLSMGTMLQYGAFNFKKIDAYIIRGEILNTTLIPLGQGANGTRHFQNGSGSSISKHGIANFL